MNLHSTVSESKALELSRLNVSISATTTTYFFNRLMLVNYVILFSGLATRSISKPGVLFVLAYFIFVTAALELAYVILTGDFERTAKAHFSGWDVELNDKGLLVKTHGGLRRVENDWKMYAKAFVLPEMIVLMSKAGDIVTPLARFPQKAQNDELITFLTSFLTVSYDASKLYKRGAPADFAKRRKVRWVFVFLLAMFIIERCFAPQ